MYADNIQSKVHSKFSPAHWLGKADHVNNFLHWNTFFRRNLHRFATDYLKLKLHIYQIVILYLMNISTSFCCVACRAAAKSFIIAIYACCRAILYPNSKIIIASGTKGQARLIVSEKIRNELQEMSPNLRREIVKITDNQTEALVFFRNGSTIKVVAANDNARGNRSTVVIYEEFRQIDKNIVDKVISPMLFIRPTPYMHLPEYRNVNELKEEPIEVFISSSWMRSHWMANTVNIISKDMLDGKDEYTVAMDYSITLKHNIRTRKQLIRERKKLDPMSWAIEYENLMPSENTHAYFSYGLLTSRQVMQKAFYPRHALDAGKGKGRFFVKKQNGEIRVLSCDIAMIDGSENDNSVYSLLRLLPESTYDDETDRNKNGYRIQLTYLEANKGMETLRQATRIKQLYTDFEADYCVLDVRSAGTPVYDALARVIYDPERDCEYAPWTCMNDPDFAKRIVNPSALPVLYAISASSRLNSDMAVNMRGLLVDKKFEMLVRVEDASDYLRQNFPEYNTTSDGEQVQFYESPYLETMLLINEMANLEYEKLEQTGLIRIRELSGMMKDRYSSVSMGCYFASLLERDLLTDDKFDFENAPMCVSDLDF